MASSAGFRKAAWGSVIAAVVVFAAFAATAAPGPGRGRGLCAEDAAKFCKDVQPGNGRMWRCLKEHENDLSPACRQHVAEMKDQAREARGACQDDALRLCGGVQRGGGRIMRCLTESENELSADCRSMLEARTGRK